MSIHKGVSCVRLNPKEGRHGLDWTHHTVVVIRRHKQRGRIRLFFDIVQRRVSEKVLEICLDLWVAIIRGPCVANRKLVKPQHVQHTHLAHGGAKQVGRLVDACRHQKAAVRSTVDGQLVVGSVAFLDEVLGGPLFTNVTKIVKRLGSTSV